jgi:hypothetical protein
MAMKRLRTGPARSAARSAANLVLAATIGLAAFATGASAARSKACRVNGAVYAALREGMSYEDVRRAIGCNGRRVSHLTIGRVHRATYSWEARGTYGANVTLTFRNRRLTDKAQLGLRE